MRVIGPWKAQVWWRPASTVCGIRPTDGFSPTTPFSDAGIRTDPAPSLPSASGPRPEATAAAAPPLEPPAVSPCAQALCVGPKRWLSVPP